MLCISICPKDEQELRHDFARAKAYKECIELRLDHFSCLPLALLKELAPSMLTVQDSQQEEMALQFASLEPQWLVLPYDMPEAVFREIKGKWPKVKIIAAYHDYEKTEHNLEAIFYECHKLPCDMVKMVTQACSSVDALRMLVFLKNHADLFPLTAFCMGEHGSFSRIVASLYGSKITFCSIEGKPTASGQLSVDELLETYHFQKIDRDTALFALIGYPITHSPSYVTHNALFRKTGRNAVYVKIPLQLTEFEQGFSLLRQLGIRGMSVTRPLKGCFQPSSNTVLCDDEVVTGNTDGIGMVEAIEEYGNVTGKKLLIIGAGPTAYAIAKEALCRGASVTIVNRTEKKAEKMARDLGCEACGVDISMISYDVLVNATCVGAIGEETCLPITDLREGTIVADVVISREDTSLIQMAKKQGLQTISGIEMWLRQAAYQFHFWDKRLLPAEMLALLREIMSHSHLR